MKEIKYKLSKNEIFCFYLRANMTILVFWGAILLGSIFLTVFMGIRDKVYTELVIIDIASFVFFAVAIIRMLAMFYKSLRYDEQLNSEITFCYSQDALRAEAGGVRGETVKWQDLLQVIKFASLLIIRLDDKNTIILSIKALDSETLSEVLDLIKKNVRKRNIF